MFTAVDVEHVDLVSVYTRILGHCTDTDQFSLLPKVVRHGKNAILSVLVHIIYIRLISIRADKPQTITRGKQCLMSVML